MELELETRKSAKLDRGLCNDEWRRSFPEASLRHLPHSYSDHCPIFLQTAGNHPKSLGRRPFRFLAAWLENRDFLRLVEEKWDRECLIPSALKKLSDDLSHWNKETF